MGICRLPCKTDYWSSDPYMSRHKIANDLGMTRERFSFMWRHFHCYLPKDTYDDDDDDDLNGSDDDDGDDELVEQVGERVMADQDNLEDSEESDGDSENEKEDEANKKPGWFDKLKVLIDHVCDVSSNLIHTLGTCLSLDEMMIRFKGKSLKTHRIKKKPIKEGFKFFVLSTMNEFILNFTHDELTAAKNKQTRIHRT